MPEHDEIAAKTVKRVLKSSGLVFFKKEMPEPGESVSAKRNDHKPEPFSCNNSEGDANKNQQGANEMQCPANWISMLGKIIGIKTPKSLIFFFHELNLKF